VNFATWQICDFGTGNFVTDHIGIWREELATLATLLLDLLELLLPPLETVESKTFGILVSQECNQSHRFSLVRE
jgi:hypothetical protein